MPARASLTDRDASSRWTSADPLAARAASTSESCGQFRLAACAAPQMRQGTYRGVERPARTTAHRQRQGEDAVQVVADAHGTADSVPR